jgi:endonuclease/exonuclease/phosphatase family metal-dependent hydrolase
MSRVRGLAERVRASRVTAALAWAVASCFALWTVVRLFGLDRGYPAVALIALTPYVAVLAAVAALLMLALRQRLPAAAALACAAALAIVVLPRAFANGPPDPRPEGPELRIFAVNLLVGGADIERIARLAESYDADVVDFSELTPEAVREIRASSLGAEMPHEALDPRPESSGTGLISRYPLDRVPAPGVEGNDLPNVIARVSLPGGKSAELYAIHPPPPNNSANVATIGRYMEAIPDGPQSGEPRLLIGDFNLTLDDDELRDLVGRGYIDVADARGDGLAPTWPRRGYPPPVTIDHVLVDDRIEALDYDTFEVHDTDHWAIAATVRLP